MLKLSAAKLNQAYKIINIQTDSKIKKRLENIGAARGALIVPLKFSAFRHNILILCSSVFLGIRQDLADSIEVVKV